jgi:hypothetical protein
VRQIEKVSDASERANTTGDNKRFAELIITRENPGPCRNADQEMADDQEQSTTIDQSIDLAA